VGSRVGVGDAGAGVFVGGGIGGGVPVGIGGGVPVGIGDGVPVGVSGGVPVGVGDGVGVSGSKSSPLTLDTNVSLGNDRVEININPPRANIKRTRPTKKSIRVRICPSLPGRANFG